MSIEQPPNVIFNDLTTAIDALSLCASLIEDSESNVQRLRWAIIVSHQAAQCWMIRALARNGEARVLNTNRKEVLKYLEELRDYPETGHYPSLPSRALESFERLYAKVKDGSPAGMGQLMNSVAFNPDPEIDRYIADLNSFRNMFVHFGPGGWILESCWAVHCLEASHKLISFLTRDSNNILWFPSELQGDVYRLVNRATVAIERLKARYCPTNALVRLVPAVDPAEV